LDALIHFFWGALRSDGRTEAFQGFRSGYKLMPGVKMFAADELADLIPSWCFPLESDLISNMIDRSKLKLGNPLPGYRFKPGECIVNSRFVHEFRQGKCTQKELDDLKMLVLRSGLINQPRRGATVFCTIVRQEGTKSHGIRLIIGGQRPRSNPILSLAITLKSDLCASFRHDGNQPFHRASCEVLMDTGWVLIRINSDTTCCSPRTGNLGSRG
jgi:hypothetical protein